MGVLSCFPGVGINTLPEYTYTGASQMLDDGDGNWRIKFLTSGTFTLLDGNRAVDLFIVGGGGGGGGGYVFNASNVPLTANTGYSVIIGAGGAGRSGSNGDGVSGGTSSGFGQSAGGGQGGTGYDHDGGNGGSGGGGSDCWGGGNGANGYSGGSVNVGGSGAGATTKEFGDSAGDQYADGGYGYSHGTGTDPGGLWEDNSGRGGNGGYTVGYEASDGNSGIVIIRKHVV
ncbi:MAG: hypothetical protein JW811_10085 [Clostridiales bacterium]|nr:hypothetical protein [Clostridiales bacterium]